MLRALACQLVTACVQNFPKGQIAAFEAGLLTRLLAMLQSDQTVNRDFSSSKNIPATRAVWRRLRKNSSPIRVFSFFSDSSNIQFSAKFIFVLVKDILCSGTLATLRWNKRFHPLIYPSSTNNQSTQAVLTVKFGLNHCKIFVLGDSNFALANTFMS